MKVLIVEDNSLSLELATTVLELAGHDVVQAESGEGVLELARDCRPDLILMDVSLPGKDGLEVTRELKTDPELRAIPVVAVTAHAMAGDQERVLAAGCEGYLTKPIDTRTFAQDVQRYAAAGVPQTEGGQSVGRP